MVAINPLMEIVMKIDFDGLYDLENFLTTLERTDLDLANKLLMLDIDIKNLPTFGGVKPSNNELDFENIYSWDDQDYLIEANFWGYTRVKREVISGLSK